MKQLLSLFSLVLFVGVGQLTAQENQSPVATSEVAKTSCSKKCSKACAAKAAQAASMDESIEKKVCNETGMVSYQRKSVCEHSGKVSYTQVAYDEATATFVDIDETAVKASSAEKKSCGKKAGCCAKSKQASADAAKVQITPAGSEGTK